MSLDLGGDTAGGDALGDAFYPLYRLLFDGDSDVVVDLERKLAEARMDDTVELYLSRSLAYGVLAGGLLWIVGTLLGYALFATGLVPVGPLLGAPIPNETLLELVIAARVPFLILVTGGILGSIGFGLAFGTLVAIPYSRASARKREINMLLSDSVSFMYALSVGGLNQLEIIEAMARAEDTYGEVAREFQTIVHETEYFGVDYRTAIRDQAMETPSDELSQFLTDMLSIVNSGGDMTRFLEDKKEKHMRTAKQQQELTLETLELFGEMYMTLSLFPLLLIIILVIMSMLGDASEFMLYATVYGLIPLTGVGFLVLVSTVKQDEPGDGYLSIDDGEAVTDGGNPLFDRGPVERYVGAYGVFDRILRREGTHRTAELLRRPHHFFRDYPSYTLALTVPAAVVIVGAAVATGTAPLSWQGFIDAPVWATFVWVYLPIYVICVPLAVFREWNVRSRMAIVDGLSDDLRKLSSANDTGMTLLESIRVVADTSSGKLSREFEEMYAKVHYGTGLKRALIEFNNRYHIPRLARTVKLISKAQEASSRITAVLTTAAQASENQDDIDRERKSRTRMQVVIIVMTYLTLLAVMAILKTQFLDVMGGLTDQAGNGGDADVGGGGMDFGGGIDTGLLSLLFFHAVTMQAILSGMISGYMRDADILSGIKYVVVLVTIALLVWMVVG
jgi:flagellar protein FlaJ